MAPLFLASLLYSLLMYSSYMYMATLASDARRVGTPALQQIVVISLLVY